MKKSLLLLSMGLLCLVARAIPADPMPVQVTQPDGTTLTVALHGDEFFHFTTTADGYTVLKNAAGYYTYARLDGDRLVPGDRIARDAAQRSAADRSALAAVPKGLVGDRMVNTGRRMLASRNGAMRVGAEGMMDYDNFRGLIILINYTNKRFTMNNANEFYNDMVNTHDFTGYRLNNRWVSMTGSVRDYFYDNSNHIFDPVFDVVGPVTVNFPCTYPQGTSNAEAVFNAALAAADDEVDFSDYDSDGDGEVDMVFFLVAGFSANYSGNNQEYLWPHMYYLWRSPARDGVGFGLYACSTEIAGWEGYYSDVNGIGTFCHEFGHVLGLPDLYDTDYNGSGGESRNPGEWSVMAGGSGNNFGRNPVGYSLYERYALGFTEPVVLDAGGDYVLQPLDLSNVGYRLNTPNQDEFFLIENRQVGKWDGFLPGHGMMVARVDSSDTRVWWSNEVNCNPNHMYYELLRAYYSGQDSDSDPFPGKNDVTSITNFTNPSLLTWDRSFNDYTIMDIAEENGLIKFSLVPDTSIITIIEDFELMPATEDQSAKGVEGIYADWDFVKCSIVNPEEGQCSGNQAVGMKKPSQLTTSAPLAIIPYMVNYTVFNPTTTEAKFKFSYSVDGGINWVAPAEGTIVIPAGEKGSASVALPIDAPIMLRFNQTAGHAKQCCYLDDIKLYYTDMWPQPVKGDVNNDGEVSISDVNLVIAIIQGSNADATVLARADVDGDGEIGLSDINKIIDLLLTAE